MYCPDSISFVYYVIYSEVVGLWTFVGCFVFSIFGWHEFFLWYFFFIFLYTSASFLQIPVY